MKNYDDTSKFVPPSGAPVTKTSSQMLMNGTTAPKVVSSQQSQPPQIQQNIHYPSFQPPSMMDYYHQNQQVSWPSAPANGFVPYAHNPYLFTSPFSYSLGGDSHYSMQYGAIQHLSSPLLNHAQVPVYQPHLHANGSHFLEQNNNFSTKPSTLVDPSNEVKREKVVQTAEQKTTNSGNSGFSLFKFAGPVPRALSTMKTNLESSDEGLCGDLSPELPTDRLDGDQACSKKDTIIEEYNLFAASKGIKFSIF